jgi:hypothetical protein
MSVRSTRLRRPADPAVAAALLALLPAIAHAPLNVLARS